MQNNRNLKLITNTDCIVGKKKSEMMSPKRVHRLLKLKVWAFFMFSGFQSIQSICRYKCLTHSCEGNVSGTPLMKNPIRLESRMTCFERSRLLWPLTIPMRLNVISLQDPTMIVNTFWCSKVKSQVHSNLVNCLFLGFFGRNSQIPKLIMTNKVL